MLNFDGTFIFVVISFLVFLFIIKTILYRPFTKSLEEREGFLAENLKIEKESKEKAVGLIKDKEQKIKQARTKAGEIIKEVATEAKSKYSKAIKETKREIKKQIEENRRSLEESELNSKKELKSEISGFVSTIVSKILNEQVEINIEEEKINEYLKI